MSSANVTIYALLPRILAGSIAFAVLAAFLLDTTLATGTIFENAAGMMRYFTIWGNVAAGLVMARIALGARVPRGVMAALATALTVIGTVYWALLAADHQPQGWGVLTNLTHHALTPLAFLAWWLAFTPPADRIALHLPAIMVLPLSYGLFAAILGELTGFYAYFFLDLPALGWARFIAHNIGLALVFAALGAALLWLHRAVRSAPAI